MNHPKPETLSDLLDGDLPAQDVVEVETHLKGCVTCSALLRDLAEVQRRARSLGEQHPPRDLWPEIARAIEDETIGDAKVIELHPWTRGDTATGKRGFRLSYVQAAAAGVVLALFSGAAGALLSQGLPHPTPGVAAAPGPAPWVEMVRTASPALGETAMEVARLEEVLDRNRDQLDPETARVLERNLGVIDRAIQESVRALEADPGNPFLESHLARSMEIRANYLREAAAFVVPVS